MNIRTITIENLPKITRHLDTTMFLHLGFYIDISLLYCENSIMFRSQITYYPNDYDIYLIKYDNKLALDDSGDRDWFEFSTYNEALKVSAQVIEYFKNDLELIGIR